MAIYEVFVNCVTGFDLPVEAIQPHPDYIREYTQSDIMAVANSMVCIGYSFPITVFEHNSVYYCLDGHLRLKALREITAKQKWLGGCVYTIPSKLPVICLGVDMDGSKKFLSLIHSHYSMNRDGLLYSKYFPGQW